MMPSYCIVMLLFAWIHIKEVHLFDIRTESVCYGNTFSSLLNLECAAGEVIQVRQTMAMAKLSSTGCPIELTSFNENSVAEKCCMFEDEDCGAVYTGSVYQEYYKRCHGNQNCFSLQASWVDIVDLDCNQTLYLPRTNYMIFTYCCIPTDFIKSPCEEQQTTNHSVYVWNTGYPSEMSAGSDSCLCAAEISCNSTIIITAIDLRFQEGSSGICTQSILVRDNGKETVIDCQSNNGFIERSVYSSKSYFVTLEIENTHVDNGGNFWIQISGEDENAEITLRCGSSYTTQAESNIKPVCGQRETTLITSSTTASSNSTMNAPTTSVTTTINLTPDADTTMSITTDPPTISSTLNNSVNESHVTVSTITTFSQSTIRELSTTSTTQTDFSNTSVSTNTNSTPDGNTNTTIQIDHSTVSSTPNSSVNESHVTMLTDTTVSQGITIDLSTTSSTSLDSSQQETEESSGISAAVLGASIAVLVILLLIVVILLWKRKLIKEKICPTKVEDEREDGTAQPEYDTMPSPFLADTTLPLITGPAATSTEFPTLPGREHVGKKPKLTPLTSPPQPQVDILHLSSSLRYQLPKLDDIQSDKGPKPNNGAKRLAQTVQDFRKPNSGNREMDIFTDEMTKDTKTGMEYLQESTRERRIRKKKKRMIDRLNRIPASGGRGSVMGFGSSSIWF